MALPRILVIMGSGETSPTMVTPHQRVFAALGDEVPAVFLDTPFGFQENAEELTGRIRTYFDDSVGRAVAPVRFRSRAEADRDPTGHAEAMARLVSARWVFAGPGSPSYALRHWSDSPVPAALDSRLAAGGTGGAVVFASAAALTLGLVTVPVYEVYKVGDDPAWLTGLDVLGRATGLRAAVVPHFDNTEGGTHDTRFCYLGERRLTILEQSLPEGAFVLGVDEHTGLVLDLDSGEGRVVGRGAVSVRAQGQTWTAQAGATVTLDELAEKGRSTRAAPAHEKAGPASGPHDNTVRIDAVDSALSGHDVRAAVSALLELDARATTPAEGEVVRAAIARLGSYAADVPVDRAAEVGPFVEALLELRASARRDKRFDEADSVRDRLDALGVEVRDGSDDSQWELRP